MPTPTDTRSASTVLRQWEKIQSTKAKLIKMGALDETATPAQVIDALRVQIPAELFPKV